MILLNLPAQLTGLCVQFNLPKNVIIPVNWTQIVAFLEEKNQFVEKQLILVQQEINDYTKQIKEEFQNKKEPLLKNELLSRRTVNPLAIYARIPSLTIFNYQYNLQKTCQELEKSLKETNTCLEQKKLEEHELTLLEEELDQIIQYNQAIEKYKSIYQKLDGSIGSYVYFTNIFMLIISQQGIFCFYKRKDEEVREKSTDKEENKESNYRYAIISQLSNFISKIMGEINYALIHMYRLDQPVAFNNYPELLTQENIELIKEYCIHKGKNFVF